MSLRFSDSDSPEILQLSDLPADAEIHFNFEKDMVVSQDTVHFLDSLQPRPDSCKSDVRNLLGRVRFRFEPLELADDLWTYPEMREYISKLNELCPCWVYYAIPEDVVLLPILACLCSDLRSVYDSAASQTIIELPADQTIPVFLKWMVHALKIANWSGVARKTINHHLYQWMQLLLPPEVAEDFKRNILNEE